MYSGDSIAETVAAKKRNQVEMRKKDKFFILRVDPFLRSISREESSQFGYKGARKENDRMYFG